MLKNFLRLFRGQAPFIDDRIATCQLLAHLANPPDDFAGRLGSQLDVDFHRLWFVCKKPLLARALGLMQPLGHARDDRVSCIQFHRLRAVWELRNKWLVFEFQHVCERKSF